MMSLIVSGGFVVWWWFSCWLWKPLECLASSCKARSHATLLVENPISFLQKRNWSWTGFLILWYTYTYIYYIIYHVCTYITGHTFFTTFLALNWITSRRSGHLRRHELHKEKWLHKMKGWIASAPMTDLWDRYIYLHGCFLWFSCRFFLLPRPYRIRHGLVEPPTNNPQETC